MIKKSEMLCVHVLQLINGKTYESIAVRKPPYPYPFPNSRLEGWGPTYAAMGGHEVRYSFSHKNQQTSDRQITHYIQGVAVGHDLIDSDSAEVCKTLKTAWVNAKNFVDFMVSLDFKDADREKMFGELCNYYSGVLDLEKVSSRHPLKVRSLKKDPSMKITGHYLYTLEPPGNVKSNLDFFGIKTKVLRGQYL